MSSLGKYQMTCYEHFNNLIYVFVSIDAHILMLHSMLKRLRELGVCT